VQVVLVVQEDCPEFSHRNKVVVVEAEALEEMALELWAVLNGVEVVAQEEVLLKRQEVRSTAGAEVEVQVLPEVMEGIPVRVLVEQALLALVEMEHRLQILLRLEVEVVVEQQQQQDLAVTADFLVGVEVVEAPALEPAALVAMAVLSSTGYNLIRGKHESSAY
jgi:hypothetical protein